MKKENFLNFILMPVSGRGLLLVALTLTLAVFSFPLQAQLPSPKPSSNVTSALSSLELEEKFEQCEFPIAIEESEDVSNSCMKVSYCLLGYSFKKSFEACQLISEPCFEDFYSRLGYSFKKSRARCEFVDNQCYASARQFGQSSESASNSCFIELPQNN